MEKKQQQQREKKTLSVSRRAERKWNADFLLNDSHYECKQPIYNNTKYVLYTYKSKLYNYLLQLIAWFLLIFSRCAFVSHIVALRFKRLVIYFFSSC